MSSPAVTTSTVAVTGGSVRVHSAGEEPGVADSAGEGAGGNGAAVSRPLVLLHGIGGATADQFPFLLPLLARHRRVISVDWGDLVGADAGNAGAADSDATGSDATGSDVAGSDPATSLPRIAAQVREAIETTLPGRTVDLVGYCLGSALATLVAADTRTPVSSLVLVAGWLSASPRLRLFIETWQQLSVAAPHTLGTFGAFASFSPAYLDAHPAAAQTPPLQASPTTTRQMQLASGIDLESVASALTIPTVVISGTHDDVASREQGRALFAAIPTARYTEVDAGHAMLRERPAEILSLISAFVANPSRHPAGSILPAAIA